MRAYTLQARNVKDVCTKKKRKRHERDLTNEHPCSDLSADGNELLPSSSDTDELSTPELSTPELDLPKCKV